MRREQHSWIAGIAAVLLVGAACGRSEPTTDPAENSDSAITTRIQARYFSDPALKRHEIEVDVDEGVVKLSGDVDSEAARMQAASLAQQTEGVVRVENEIEIEVPDAATTSADRRGDQTARDAGAAGPSRDRAAITAADERMSAGWITTKIQAQYFADDDVKGRRIDVTTSPSRVVTLTGEVESEAVRKEAVQIARSTEGVTNVVDELRVVAAQQAARTDEASPNRVADDADADLPNDGWLTTKIEAKYFLDPDVKGRDIDVTTENGIVTLAGRVESAAERRQAVALARATDGVREVRDQLRVQPDADSAADADDRMAPGRQTPEQRAAAAPVDDNWIETRIQSKYFLEDDLKTGDVDVSSQKGVVTLTGEVDSQDAKQTAEEIARETDGVSNIVNRLAVSGEVTSER
jgi:osmotically-inducible protein OsmY